METEFESEIAKVLHPILCGICHELDKLNLTERIEPMGVALTCEVGANDNPVMVGRKGVMINSIKHLVERGGRAHQQRWTFELVNSNDGQVERHHFKLNRNFDETEFVRLFTNFCDLIDLDTSHVSIRSTTHESEDDTLSVRIPAEQLEDRATIFDLSALFYRYGIKQGRKIDIKIGT